MINLDEILVLTWYPDYFKEDFKHVLHYGKRVKDFESLYNQITQLSIKCLLFTNHYFYLSELIDFLDKKNIQISIAITHQKRYFPKTLVPKIGIIFEYSIVGSKKFYPQYINYNYLHKYKHLYFPSFIRENERDYFLEESKKYKGEPYFFTGGQNARNYDIIIEAFRNTKYNLRIVSKNKIDTSRFPENIQVIYNLERNDFLQMMANSICVIIPVSHNVTSIIGETMSSEALVLGKPIISSDVINMRDKFDDEAILVDNQINSIENALNNIMDHKIRKNMAQVSYKKGCQITFESYISQIKEHLSQIV